MNISSTDGRVSTNVGGKDTWQALTATVRVLLKNQEKSIPYVFEFLTSGKCSNEKCLEAARQFNMVRDELTKFSPDKMVYDEHDLKKLPPWGADISPVITSCGNYFTSGDGYDLLSEIVRVFTYASYAKCGVHIV